MNDVSIVISLLALCVSGVTAWLTLFKRGTVLMTQPTTVYFGPDGGHSPEGSQMKVYLRTLLYATSKRGRLVESMFVRLRRGETTQNFNVWVYGEDKLRRGSGLFIPDNGVTTNHHFLLPADGTVFTFFPGTYRVEVFASLVGDGEPRLMRSIGLNVSAEQSAALMASENGHHGLYFDWGPDSGDYHAHIKTPSHSGHEVATLLRGLVGSD